MVNSSIKYRAIAGIPFRPGNKAYKGLGMPLHGANRRTSSPFASPCLQANRGNNATPFPSSTACNMTRMLFDCKRASGCSVISCSPLIKCHWLPPLFARRRIPSTWLRSSMTFTCGWRASHCELATKISAWVCNFL
ncbi:hypothetical protein CB373_07445 [Salmonella enterica subsp. enterica serovar Westminster]|nr:hypothetical protein [Salmonella enterica subsp. enterica serovar Westminster]